jgi:hypothetical protein
MPIKIDTLPEPKNRPAKKEPKQLRYFLFRQGGREWVIVDGKTKQRVHEFLAWREQKAQQVFEDWVKEHG